MNICEKCGNHFESKKCKICEKMRLAKWYRDNKEKVIQRAKIWKENNLEKSNEIKKLWAEKNQEKVKLSREKWKENNNEKIKNYYLHNAEKIKIKTKLWRENNSSRAKLAMSIWQKNNLEKCRIINHNYRARKRTNGGKLSKNLAIKLNELQKGKCACCKIKLNGKYHLDHIIPISLNGENIDSNIQLLCPKCNQQKHSKHPIQFMQSKGYLL